MNFLFRPVSSTVKTVWIARHMLYHVFIGLAYAWVLRELWGVFNPRFVALAVVGSILPDVDHVVYIFFYGRNDTYAKRAKEFFRHFKVRSLISFFDRNHKNNTALRSHNIATVGGLLAVSLLSFFIEFETGVILFGAMCLHLLFDMIDDLLILGELNSNWNRHRGRRVFKLMKKVLPL